MTRSPRRPDPLPKYLAEGRSQVRRYQDYCKNHGLDPAFPMEASQLALYLHDTPGGWNTKNTAVSQMARVTEHPKDWSRAMRSDPAVRDAVRKRPSSKNDTLPPVLATICKRRPLEAERWIVQHI